MEKKLFGTDGIRGKANRSPMDALTAYKVGAAIGYYFGRKDHKAKILIGRDTRLSGTMLEGAIVAGACAVGCDTVTLGVISTPGVAFLTHSTDADAGVVISASHNPFVDNGIKIFSHDGFKLPDEIELELEKLILKPDIEDLYAEPHRVGTSISWQGGQQKYLESLIHTMEGETLEGLRIVVDCANGAAYQLGPQIFRQLGAEVFEIGILPDGTNINKACGSLHIEEIKKLVLKNDADLGVAFDGDADRAIFVDHKGCEVDGDHIMAICAKQLKENNKLAKDTLVGTVMSNLGLLRSMEGIGVTLIKTDVGDRYVVREMRESGYNFGGEQSGHLIFLDYSTSGDGVLTALQLVKIIRDTGKSLEELSSVMTTFPQVLKNLMVSYKRPLNELDNVLLTIERIEKILGREGRVLVRYSGTENKVRVMVEGTDKESIEKYAKEIIESLDAELN